MTNSTIRRLERILRQARKQVFNNPESENKIIKCKKLLDPIWKDIYNTRQTKKIENWLMVN